MTEKKAKLLRARIALALYEENGRRPTDEELERWTRASRILYRAIIMSFFERKQMKKVYHQLCLL